MARVKGSNIHKNRRKKVLKLARGYFGSKHKLYKTAKEQVMHSLKYAYRDRKQNKREMRKLWITRINAACRMNDISYSKFISGLNKANIEINRKMLSEIAIADEKAFSNLVNVAKDALEGKTIKQEVKTTKTETKKVEKKEVSEDLSKLTVAELKKLAKDKNIDGYTTMKKAELLDALK
ncbi:MAG: 50S ribosomal protein L20 [bacterium]|nr:50S ribosomal protein L20 [bacterium]